MNINNIISSDSNPNYLNLHEFEYDQCTALYIANTTYIVSKNNTEFIHTSYYFDADHYTILIDVNLFSTPAFFYYANNRINLSDGVNVFDINMKKFGGSVKKIGIGINSRRIILNKMRITKKIIPFNAHHVTIICPNNIGSISKCFEYIFIKLGLSVTVKESIASDDQYSEELYLIICNMNPTVSGIPIHSIVYQVEQMNSNRFSDKYMTDLSDCMCIWEFSMKNTIKYDTIPKNKIHYMQMPFYQYQPTDTVQEIKYDILFYGSSNNRRTHIIEALSKKYNIYTTNSLFGKEKEDIIQQSKIIINIHYYQNAGLECVRINEALQYNKLVLSESVQSDQRNMDFYSDVVVFFDEIDPTLSQHGALYGLIDYWLDDQNYNNRINQIKKIKPLLEKISIDNVYKNLQIARSGNIKN